MPRLYLMLRRPRSPRRLRSAAAFVLEGELQLGAIGRDLALFDDEVLLDDLGDAQVAQGFRRALHGNACGLSQDTLLVPTNSTTL